ncbi:hypothetical protein Tco_0470649 [Tanacetum coccineum]
MFEFKTKKPEESSSNWKPWHKDWVAITSNHSEDDIIKDDGKYRYNGKGFLEDDESSDDSILIMDPEWDDYFLQELFYIFKLELAMKMWNGVLEATTRNGNKEVTRLFLELKGDDRGACKLLGWLLGES